MSSKEPSYIDDCIDYFKRSFKKEVSSWIALLRYYGLALLIFIILVIGLIAYLNPISPNKAYLATGQMGSSYKVLAEKFDSYFERSKMDLVLVDSYSRGDGLEKLDQASSPVNASFLTTGSADSSQYPNLESLGSIQYSPIWLFYRGPEIDTDSPMDYFGTKKIAIGLPKTTTQNIFKKLLGDSKNHSIDRPNFYQLSHHDAAEQLLDGKLDAAIIVDGIRSPIVQKLLKSKDINLYSFNLSAAYEKQFPFLSKLIIPKGSLDIERVYPKKDIQLIAPSVILLIEKEMHPVMQWAFLLAAKEVAAESSHFFTKPGFFPAKLDDSFPLSPIAKRFYDHGVPSIFSYLPLSIASFIDRFWVLILSLLAVAFPLHKIYDSFRKIPTEENIGNWNRTLHDCDWVIKYSANQNQIEAAVDELIELEKTIANSFIEESLFGSSFGLRNSIARVKNDGIKKIEVMGKAG